MKAIRSLICATVIMAGCHTAAFAACTPDNAIFSDQFTDSLGGWDPDKQITIADGKLVVVIKKGDLLYQELNNNFQVKDARICFNATFPKADKVDKTQKGEVNNAQVGLIFAAVDYRNFYLFQINSTGTFGLYRKIDGKWNTLLAEQPSPAIKGGFGADNQLEVPLKGNVVTLFINGQQVGATRIQTPGTEMKFGFYVQVDEKTTLDAGVPFVITNYIVNQP